MASQLFTTRNIIISITVLILILGIYFYSTRKNTLEKMTNNAESTTPTPTSASGDVPFKTSQTNMDVPDRSVTNPNDLLPNGAGNWGNLYPVKNDGGVFVPSITSADFQIGVNTISSTLKNPSLDIRSNPIIPKQVVSPWNNSSYEPDIGKIGLDPASSTRA